MRRSMVAQVALALALATAGCASSGGTHAPPRNRYLITSDEIAKSNATNAMEAVERLRPAFLTTHGPTSIQDPNPPTAIVYLDGIKYGDVRSLPTIPALGIATIQYLPPIEAGMRFGLGHDGGAILIVSKH